MSRQGPCAIGTALLAGWAVGVSGELNFNRVTLDTDYVGYERAVADVNHDGTNDVVCVSENDNVIRAFLAPDWTKVVLATPSGPYVWPRADDFKAFDMDGDGDADLVARLGPAQLSDAPGIAAWFENREEEGWVQHSIGESSGYVKDIAVADLDRDGRPDVIMRQDSETQVYFQEAAGWTPVTIAHLPHEGMDVGDLDGDGDPDIVLNGFWFPTPNTPAAARNPAKYKTRTIDPRWFNQSGDWTANSCKVVVGDFDGDGSNDVAFSHSERAGYPIRWYRNANPLSDAGWESASVGGIDFCHTLQAEDWDLDGDLDLLAGGMIQSPHKGLRLFLNGGKANSWTVRLLQSQGSYSAEAGDLDNDGDPDIVGIINWDSAPTYFYRNNSAGPPSLEFWAYRKIAGDHIRTFGLCFPDVDRDGDLDIASGPFVYRNPGPPLAGGWSRVPLPGGVHAFSTLDVDGDKFADLMAQRDNPAVGRVDLFWVESANRAGTVWKTPVKIGRVPRGDHPQGFQGSRVAQLVAGGRPEIAVSTPQGIYVFAVPAASPEGGHWPRIFVAANDSEEGIGVADVDGDGDNDIGFTSGGTREVKWARNPGDGSGDWSVFTIGVFPEADWPDRCEAADLNGDGRVDIVATEENSGASADALACWWEQPESGATSPGWTRHVIARQYTMNSLDVADMDRDGDTDIVLAEHRGTKRIAVWENDGLGVFKERRVGSGRESHLGARAADLDGDGDLDLISIAYDEFMGLHLWRNDSPEATDP
jgi:hypothetical protein